MWATWAKQAEQTESGAWVWQPAQWSPGQTWPVHYRSWSAFRLQDLSRTRSESRRDQEESWTLAKTLDAFAGPGETKRREVVLDPQVSPEEIKSREVELGLKFRLFCISRCFPTAELRTLSLWPFRTAVGTVTAWYTSCCAMAKRTMPQHFVVLAAVHGILGLPGWRLRLSLHSFVPLAPVPNKHSRSCGR